MTTKENIAVYMTIDSYDVVDMGMFRYITNRTLPNKAGKENAGRIRAFVKTGSNTLEGEYVCPECGNEGKINQVFRRPLSIRCEKCNLLMRMPKLKGKMK